MQRCLDKNSYAYAEYGGRGITVCEHWQDFTNFYADMGEKPEGLSLDRIDVNGNYEPSNCRWATASEQVRNRRCAVVILVDGVQIRLDDYCKQVGIKYGTGYARMQRGKLEKCVF